MKTITVPTALLQSLLVENAKLRGIAYQDALTGLYNRARLELDMSDADTQGYEYAYIIFDADGLKQANDTHGHEAGDELLRQIAKVLRHEAGRRQDGAYRLGGDEFVLLMRDCTSDGIKPVVERVQALLEDAGLSASAGGGHSSEEGFVALADSRMYADKVRRKGAGNIR